MKKTRGKLHFFIFRKIFGALEAKMMKNDKNMKKNEKKWKKLRENCNFSFFGKLQFSSSLFFIFLSFFIIFHHFSSIPPLEAKMIKKMIKKWKKLEENCTFFIFRKIFGALEAKMMKNEKKMKKMKKNEKNWGKIAIFHFLENCNFPRVCFSFFFHFFYHFSSFFIIFHQFHPPLEAKMINKWLKNDKKKWKKLGKLHFFIFRKIFGALEAKMMKNDKNVKKNEKKWKKKWKKTEGKLQFFIFWKIAIFLEFVFHFFFIFFHFSSFFIIFHQFHHWKQKW